MVLVIIGFHAQLMRFKFIVICESFIRVVTENEICLLTANKKYTFNVIHYVMSQFMLVLSL